MNPLQIKTMAHLDVTDWALSVLVTLGALVLPVTLVTLSVLVTLGARALVTGRPLAPASPRLTLGVLTNDVSPGVFLVILGVLVTEGVLMLPDLLTMGARLTDGVLTTADGSPGVFLLVTGVAAFLLVTARGLELFSGVEALLAPAAGLKM